jgi:hypothetical protein
MGGPVRKQLLSWPLISGPKSLFHREVWLSTLQVAVLWFTSFPAPQTSPEASRGPGTAVEAACAWVPLLASKGEACEGFYASVLLPESFPGSGGAHSVPITLAATRSFARSSRV